VYIQDRRSNLSYTTEISEVDNVVVKPFGNDCRETFNLKGIFKDPEPYYEILEAYPDVMPWVRMDKESGYFFYSLPIPRQPCRSKDPFQIFYVEPPKGKLLAICRFCNLCIEKLEEKRLLLLDKQ